MVSLRRRKLLGLSTGNTSAATAHSKPEANETVVENSNQNLGSNCIIHVLSVDDIRKRQEQEIMSIRDHGIFVGPHSSPSKEEPIQQYPVPEVKRRKQHRRKHIEDREPCIMRGVYFKNMKWQAAIKVDKKQIHLGTVGSQEEAARLYDRAAYMCGREPNFELSEQEKQELSRYKWDEFLAITRNAITNKKHQRRLGSATSRKSEDLFHEDLDQENGVRASSLSDDMDEDALTS